MLPETENSPEIDSHPKPFNAFTRRLNSIQTHSFIIFVTAFFSIPSLLVCIVFRNSSPIFSDHIPVQVQNLAAAGNGAPDEVIAQPIYTKDCPFGQIYVLQIPPMFNDDLLIHNCSDLDPWNWQCGIAVDHGYGRRATELRRILPESLAGSWHRTNLFSLELIFHHRILNHRCRTTEPRSAAAFYIPFYAGLSVGRYLWAEDTSKRDRDCKAMIRWIVRQKHWNKFLSGADHFTTIGRITWDFRRFTDPEGKWGSALLQMPAMKRIRRLIIEKAWDDDYDVAAPYPTGFHPSTAKTLENWMAFVRDYNRSSLTTFIDGARGSPSSKIHGLLRDYCQNEPESSCRLVNCSAVQCSTDVSVMLEPLLGSEFCLEPLGDGFTGRTVFECVIAGAVPVFFWKGSGYDQYEGLWPGEAESFAVLIEPEAAVKNGRSVQIGEILGKLGKEEIRVKRERVIETIPKVIYGKWNNKEGFLLDGDFRDAFDIVVDRVLERIKKEKEDLNLLYL